MTEVKIDTTINGTEWSVQKLTSPITSIKHDRVTTAIQLGNSFSKLSAVDEY